jgi:hypothetical protein
MKPIFTNRDYSNIQNTTISIVSNSNSLLNSNYGKLIDSSDVVIRFNKFVNGTDYVKDIGKKLNAYCHHYHNEPPIIDTSLLKQWFVCCVSDENIFNKYGVPNIQSTIIMSRKMKGGFETTGLTMIRWVVDNISFKELKLFGFASGQESHYYNLNDRMLPWHNMKYEETIIKDIVDKNNKIKLLY